MKRRTFLRTGALAGAAAVTRTTVAAQPLYRGVQPEPFNLNYAPHLGMFRSLAGDDPIDQLDFMADQGFTAFEDNGMKGRESDLQERMAATMARRGIKMGVFVAHTIHRDTSTCAWTLDIRRPMSSSP